MAIDSTFEHRPGFLRESVVEELALENDLARQLELFQITNNMRNTFIVDETGTTTPPPPSPIKTTTMINKASDAAAAAPTPSATQQDTSNSSNNNNNVMFTKMMTPMTPTKNKNKMVDVSMGNSAAFALAPVKDNHGDVVVHIMQQNLLETLAIAVAMAVLLWAPNHLL
eukprot:CAMPEP_0116555392 /NCGR_PEP_ID=MMETSP0397-20121206/8126_1 /TAXON_ID=216820 /ORGANISM="Cyclophora tenuis, Strain ECT3854" /LENGTH=168 /DNA_ID=CAMNT_0004080667 /DNA_START=99 /DNA_END=605 /DNA_ORIENTATION=+